MWCQNHKQCSKVMWPSPLSFPVNEMRASLSEDGAQVETGRALRRSRNGSPFSDVDTASSEEARSVGASACLLSYLLLRTRRHYAQSSKILKELNAPSVCDSGIVFPALAVWNFGGDALLNASRRACLRFVRPLFKEG